MATVMAAYSEMKEIMDHSFQGKKKGSENQREFMSRNLVAMRNALVTYQDTNPLERDQKFFSVGPKVPTVLPCEWIISNGNLRGDLVSFDGQNVRFNFDFPLPYITGESGSYSLNVGDALDAIGIKAGMQFTFLSINASGGSRIFEVYNEDYAGYTDFDFMYRRLVFKKNIDRDAVLTVATSDNYQANLWVSLLNAIKDDKTTISIPAAGEWTVGNGFAQVFAEEISAGYDESATHAFGIIASMVDEDLRSTSKMKVLSTNFDGSSLGLTWDYIWDAWRKTGSTLGESDLYLEGGSV